jgi:hypothetical protein
VYVKQNIKPFGGLMMQNKLPNAFVLHETISKGGPLFVESISRFFFGI